MDNDENIRIIKLDEIMGTVLILIMSAVVFSVSIKNILLANNDNNRMIEDEVIGKITIGNVSMVI